MIAVTGANEELQRAFHIIGVFTMALSTSYIQITYQQAHNAFPFSPLFLYLPNISPFPHPAHSSHFPSPSPPSTTLNTKFTNTATANAIASTVGPTRSSNPPCPRIRILRARQWNVISAYSIVPIATSVNRPAEMRPTESPKLSRPMARPPRRTVKFR